MEMLLYQILVSLLHFKDPFRLRYAQSVLHPKINLTVCHCVNRHKQLYVLQLAKNALPVINKENSV